MNETVRQHFVPRTYLKHFSTLKDDKYFIGAATTPFNTASSIKEIAIENICVEKHLYTLPGATTEERMWVERLYSEVFEREYDKLYEMLTDAKKVRLSNAEREFIITTVMTMYYRTTNWNNFAYYAFGDILERGYNLAKQTSHDYFMLGDQKISIANKSVEELKKEDRERTRVQIALTQIRHAIKLAAMRSLQDAVMITQLQGEDEFITSDNPVECNNLDRKHIVPINPSNTFSLPLDEKHHLTLIPGTANKSLFTINRTRLPNRLSLFSSLSLNFGQAKNAQKFLLGKKTALQTFLDGMEIVSSPNATGRFKETRELVDWINKNL